MTNGFLIAALLLVAAYLIGSVSFAVVISKLMGLSDPRSFGSGNPGATNVLRTGNKTAAVLTLLGDGIKGFFGAALPLWALGTSAAPQWLLVLAPIAVVFGHAYPVFHQFKGGKGVATAAGAMFAIHWVLGLMVVVTWVVIVLLFKISSLASLVACGMALLYGLLFFDIGSKWLAIAAISLLVIWRHRENIARLMAGTESRIGGAKSSGTSNISGNGKSTSSKRSSKWNRKP